MDKRERVLACMNHLPVDRPPVGFWFHFREDQKLGQACVQAHLDYYNHVDVDMVKIMCDGYFDYPNPLAQSVKTASDWYHLKPLGKDHPFIREQVERAKQVKAGLKDNMCVFYNVFAPFSSIRFGTSDEMVMEHFRQDPKAIASALSVIAEDNSTLCELLLTEAGCDGVYYCVQGGEKDRMTGEEYRAYITPSDKAVLSHANKFSPYNILHCCGWASRTGWKTGRITRPRSSTGRLSSRRWICPRAAPSSAARPCWAAVTTARAACSTRAPVRKFRPSSAIWPLPSIPIPAI